MDAEMNRRWREALPPFDGITVYPSEYLSLPALRIVLAALVGQLERQQPGTQLYTLHDWHEHDGYISLASPSSWDEVHGWLASDDALYASRSGDTYVRTAVFPEARDWYLRIYVPDDGDRAWLLRDQPPYVRIGTFDVTGSQAIAAELLSTARQWVSVEMAEVPAVTYFNQAYGG